MQITFDPRNPEDCASVMALLGVLGGAVPAAPTADDGDDTPAPSGAVQPGETDARGVPFLPEYHTGTRNKDGSWRYRKNIDRDAAEKAEMTARSANPIATPDAAANPTPAPSPAATAVPTAGASPALPFPSIPSSPAPIVTYESVVATVSAAAGKHGISGETWGAILVEAGAVNAAGGPDPSALQTNETARANVARIFAERYP